MALMKIYAKPEKHNELLTKVAGTIKLIAAAALSVESNKHQYITME